MTAWIKHDGVTMPVSGDALVEVKFDDGQTMKTFASEWSHPDPRNSHWIWDPKNVQDADIVAYRVVMP